MPVAKSPFAMATGVPRHQARPAAKGSRSLTARLSACLHPMCRSVVWTNACPQQELDLLQFAARSVAQSRAGPPQVVRCQFLDPTRAAQSFNIPDDIPGDPVSPYVPLFRIERNSLPFEIEALSVQRSTAFFAQAGTVRTWPAFPTRSTIAQ
jgi:hypothetical protein